MPIVFDSLRHAPSAPAELFIVEGESAAKAVCAVRDPALQAVLPLQGKPVNAVKASPGRVLASPWLSALTDALGTAPGTSLPLGELRYERVVLLMDPDADGIHAGALVQIFLLQYMRRLLEEGRVAIVHAPWGEVRLPDQDPLLAFHEAEFQQMCRSHRPNGVKQGDHIRYRGLGTITPSILERVCVNSTTRRAHNLTAADAEIAAKVFGASRSITRIDC
jgi:DNA gyrase subunit B